MIIGLSGVIGKREVDTRLEVVGWGGPRSDCQATPPKRCFDGTPAAHPRALASPHLRGDATGLRAEAQGALERRADLEWKRACKYLSEGDSKKATLKE